MNPCPCGSAKAFAACCKPFLTLTDKPRSVRQLVRARYTAYALGAGRHRDFLIGTWHPSTAHNIHPADLRDSNLRWTGLEILASEQSGDLGRVDFIATFTEGDDSTVRIHHERASFHRISGVWLYLEGAVEDE